MHIIKTVESIAGVHTHTRSFKRIKTRINITTVNKEERQFINRSK